MELSDNHIAVSMTKELFEIRLLVQEMDSYLCLDFS